MGAPVKFLPQATLEVESGWGRYWEDLDKQYLLYLGCDSKQVSAVSSEPQLMALILAREKADKQ